MKIMASLEREILAEARVVFDNPKLRKKDLLEWSTGPVTAQPGEVVELLPTLRVSVAIDEKNDRRPETE